LFIPLQLSTTLPLALLCIAGIGFAYRSAIPLLDSLVGRVLPDPTGQYGRIRVAGSVGFILTSLFFQLTGLISGDSAMSILLSFAATAVLAAGAVAFLPHVPRPGHGSPSPSMPRPGQNASIGLKAHGNGFDSAFWAVIGVIFLARFGISAHYSFFSLYLKERFALTNVSMIWAIGSAAELATIYFSGRLIARFGIRMLLIVSLAAVSLRLAIYGMSPSLALVAAAQLLHAFTFGTLHTASVAYVNQKIGGPRRGLGMAIYNAVGIGVPNFIASSAGGFLIEARGFSTLFLVYAAVPLLGILILAAFGKRLLPRKGFDIS
jgi:PPP family 3-phenylpropionic acid transporter